MQRQVSEPLDATSTDSQWIGLLTWRISGSSKHDGHFRLHELHKLRCQKSASWLKQVLDFDGEFVNGRISGRNAVQSAPKPMRALDVNRAFPSCLRIDKIEVSRNRPGCINQRNGLLKESCAEPDEWISESSAWVEQSVKGGRLLDSYRHALAIDWIETADRIAHGEQADWQVRQSLKMAPHACRKVELGQPFGWRGVLDGIVHGWRSQLEAEPCARAADET
jgi:hypothetical protein